MHLHVQSQELWSTGKHTLNCYVSTQSKILDKYFYLADDVINHMMVCTIEGIGAMAVIAVQDRIRVIDGKGKLLYSTQLDSYVTCFDIRPEPSSKGFPLLVFGTKAGSIGAVELTTDEAIVLWECDFTFDGKSSVSHIKVA